MQRSMQLEKKRNATTTKKKEKKRVRDIMAVIVANSFAQVEDAGRV